MITSKIKRPALRYYGGKWNIASWIIRHFPKHKSYVEPCGGGANVLFRKSPSPLETYNDLDGNVVNFFRVLRDRPDELIRKIQLTPWARSEYELHRKADPDPVEMARRFWVGCTMSIGSMAYTKSGMRINYNSCSGRPPAKINIDHLEQVAVRLGEVQIDNRDWRDLVKKTDSPDTLYYLDPPYLQETRTSNNWYAFEWSEADHVEAADILQRAKGYVILSGYSSPLYTKLYEAYDWQRVDKKATTNSGGKRIESLWLSPHTWKALNEMQQGKLL